MNVVITGANRGLGLELARAYAARGDRVVAGCRTPATAEALSSSAAHVLAVDTGDEGSVTAFSARALEHCDGVVDVLVNNAGLDATGLGVPDGERDVLTLSSEHFLAEMRVNAVGPMLVARGLLPGLVAAERGRIVNVSSQVGSMVVAARMGRDVGYTASKAALNMVTVKQAARLQADGVVAIALHPGYLRTDMGGAGADLDPADAAASIVSLIDALTPEQSGSFLRWDGTVHPW